jgi:hypothetical protein
MAGVTLPAASVMDPDTDHVPSVSAGRSQEVADPTKYEQLTEDAPFVAVSVATSPPEPPPTETVGVVSEVMLSVDDVPESDDAARSGPDDATGPVPSMVTFIPVLAADVLPAGSVSVPDTDHVPSVSAGRSHDVAEPMTYVHNLVVEPFVAVTVAVSPVEPPGTENAGVVSFVRLSVDDEPESDAASRSGAAGADGAEVSTDNDSGEPAADVLPAGSVTFAVTDQLPAVSAGRSQDEADPAT